MNPRAHKTVLNLDILALSLLCCLLGSVVGVLVLSGEEVRGDETRLAEEKRRTEARLRLEEQNRIYNELHQQTGRFQIQVHEVEQAREAVVAKLNYAALERENRALKSRGVEIQQKVDLATKLASVKAESARLEQELKEKEKTANASLSPEARRMLGEYKGRYVLLECIEDYAILFPGKERIAMEPAREQVEKLMNQITKAGFVVFVVRPAGWFNNSYDKLRKVVYGELDKLEKQGEGTVGRSTFPLDAAEPIVNYLPPE